MLATEKLPDNLGLVIENLDFVPKDKNGLPTAHCQWYGVERKTQQHLCSHLGMPIALEIFASENKDENNSCHN